MFFQVVISPKFIKDYFYCLTNQKCVQSFICILGECLLTRFSNILGFWIQDEAGTQIPGYCHSLSLSLSEFVLLIALTTEIVTDYISLLFDLTPKIIYHRARYVFPFHPLLDYVNILNETTQRISRKEMMMSGMIGYTWHQNL